MLALHDTRDSINLPLNSPSRLPVASQAIWTWHSAAAARMYVAASSSRCRCSSVVSRIRAVSAAPYLFGSLYCFMDWSSTVAGRPAGSASLSTAGWLCMTSSVVQVQKLLTELDASRPSDPAKASKEADKLVTQHLHALKVRDQFLACATSTLNCAASAAHARNPVLVHATAVACMISNPQHAGRAENCAASMSVLQRVVAVPCVQRVCTVPGATVHVSRCAAMTHGHAPCHVSRWRCAPWHVGVPRHYQ